MRVTRSKATTSRATWKPGKLPTRLALTFDDRISFVLTEKLEIKRLDFPSTSCATRWAEADKDDAEALFNAEFALDDRRLAHLLPAVVAALGGSNGHAVEPRRERRAAALPRVQADAARVVSAGVAADDPPFSGNAAQRGHWHGARADHGIA